MPWPLDQVGGVVRSVLGVSERAEADVIRATPLRETEELEAKLDETVAAVHRACESIERHADSIGALSDSLPALTASVRQLTEQLSSVMEMTAPLAAAEREASQLGRLLHRRPHTPGSSAGPAPGAAETPSSEPPHPADA